MPVKPDRWIIQMAQHHQMIEPFAPEQVRSGISFGVSCYGYDFRLSDEFKIPDFTRIQRLDPKQPSPECWDDVRADMVEIPANSFVLGRSLEYFRIPRDVITICTGKSTYARSGLIVNVTPFEPEWEGFATLSLSNTAPVPLRLYAGEGIAQLLFLEGSEPCLQSYKDKQGKYQSQKNITFSRSE